eukprot:PITA_06077
MTDHHSLTSYFNQPTLNARQARWVDLLSGFDFEIKHLKGKGNRVADALSRKMHCLYEISTSKGWSNFHEEIKQAAEEDAEYQQKKQQVQEVASHIRQQGYELKAPGILYYKKRIYIPNHAEVKKRVLDEYHKSPYAGHPGYQTFINALRKECYWPGMKKEVMNYLARCIECQQVKVEHQHPAELLQPLPIPEWKWEVITMDFIIGLHKSKKGLGNQLNFSIAYHPQTDGQTERVNQVVEDMLRSYVMQQPSRWEEYLHLVEFAYNNGYHASLQMSPFEVLYGWRCRTPSSWSGPEDKLVLGPEMLKEMEQMLKKVRANLKVAQDRQKSYADRKRNLKEFQVGEHVYVRIRAKKSTLQWSGCTKLSPRFCGPFYILARIGPVAYQLALPSHIRVHNVFHVSVLKKYIYDPKHIISWQDIQVEPEGELLVEPVSILDWRRVVLRKRAITQVKLQWQHFGPDEATWEDE